jgi:hypothetical protein
VGEKAQVKVLDSRRYFPRVSEAKVHGRGGHLAQHLVQAAAAHPLHDVHGICSVAACGHDNDAVGVAHTGTNRKFVNEFLEVALGEGALQGGLDGDQHAVQQPLLHTAMSSRLRGKTRVQLHITALNDFQADLGIEFEAGVDELHVLRHTIFAIRSHRSRL